jgi:hypothetical protein
MPSDAIDAATVVTTLGLTALLLAGIWSAGKKSPDNRSTARWMMAVVIVWSATVMILASQEVFASEPDTQVPFIGMGIVLPIAIGIVLYRSVEGVRRLVSSLPLHTLIGAQVYRVLGVLFLLSWARGELPSEFALPAGIGDVAVGLAAPAVAYAVYTRRERAIPLATAWNVVGIADLVIAVAFGFLTSPSVFQQLALDAPNFAITRFPLVLIPTFAVPVSVLLHYFALTHPEARGARTKLAVPPGPSPLAHR